MTRSGSRSTRSPATSAPRPGCTGAVLECGSGPGWQRERVQLPEWPHESLDL